ncbi:EamA family transporter [Pseudotamlana agarivorans]|uniref:EamA family transporter n=1 Tax=Pseudotamlana agarivorans TaxID=481183 RepID=UPI00083428CC|nr:DMT family transporter [Tamlana agarivorans]
MTNLKGILYVIIGAASYGMLATFIKKANLEGLSTSGLNFLQYVVGATGLIILTLGKEKKKDLNITNTKPERKLILFGTTTGLTSFFYYLSIQYISVSVGIILLMQTIWMGVVLETLLTKKWDKLKLLGSLVTIIGTLLAVNVFESRESLNLFGVFLGILASVFYTGSLYASNSVSLELPNLKRSKYLVFGGLIIVTLLWNSNLIQENNFSNTQLWKYGLFLGFFGAILPPIVFNKGFPIVGIGLGSILTSIEIPVSITMAYLVLDEEVKLIQWLGVFIIISSVILINLKNIKTGYNNAYKK